jgi:prepilin-type N-terminal cleavage/methylation domain-containing protein
MTRAGTTLIEMMIALTILAIMSAVAMPALRSAPPPRHDIAETVADSARVAVASCRDVRIRFAAVDRAAYATARCDGSIIADTSLQIDSVRAHASGAR